LVSQSRWPKFDKCCIEFRFKKHWKKPGQTSRVRQSRSNVSSRNEGMYTDIRTFKQTAETTGGDQLFNLKWLNKTKSRVCYGCSGKLRPDESGVPPPPGLILRNRIRLKLVQSQRQRIIMSILYVCWLSIPSLKLRFIWNCQRRIEKTC
jgi:hypothetical protein